MAPVAQGLDFFQGSNYMVAGALIPGILCIRKKLLTIQEETLRYHTTLLEALLESLDRRFRHIYADDDLILAAALHPFFRVGGTHQVQTQMPQLKITQQVVLHKLQEVVESYLKEHDKDVESDSSSCNGPELELDNDLQFIMPLAAVAADGNRRGQGNKTTTKKRAAEIVRLWQMGNASYQFNDEAFNNEPSLTNLFLRYNTAMPSSAPVERIFSIGKDIHRAKRNRLSDQTFDTLMFLKGNSARKDAKNKTRPTFASDLQEIQEESVSNSNAAPGAGVSGTSTLVQVPRRKSK